MLHRRTRQGNSRTVLRGTRPPPAVYFTVGLSVVLLTMFLFSEELEAAAATIALVPATGLIWVAGMRQWERRLWERRLWERRLWERRLWERRQGERRQGERRQGEQWRQKGRSRGEERTRGNTGTTNDAEPRTWWEVLEISERSTFEDVKTAYRTKIKECHPDKVMGLAREFQELADRKTKEVNLAFRQARIACSKLPPKQ
jgi:DnaJ-domain-containing protein 1